MTKPKLKLDFGKFTFIDNILIAELNEGILLDVEKNRKLLEIGRKMFKKGSYGYISNRVHSYAVNPMVYLESASTPTLKGIAVVTIIRFAGKMQSWNANSIKTATPLKFLIPLMRQSIG